jgi:hypothetical protein
MKNKMKFKIPHIILILAFLASPGTGFGLFSCMQTDAGMACCTADADGEMSCGLDGENCCIFSNDGGFNQDFSLFANDLKIPHLFGLIPGSIWGLELPPLALSAVHQETSYQSPLIIRDISVLNQVFRI